MLCVKYQRDIYSTESHEKNAFYLFSKRFIDFFFNVFLVNKNEIFYISTTFEEKKNLFIHP